MASGGQHPVVILYEHALLGEGIAKYLRAQLGVEARVVSAFDLQAVTSALALGPAVVIFELTEPLNQVDLTTLAPHAVLIDVKHGRDARPGPLPRRGGASEDPASRARQRSEHGIHPSGVDGSRVSDPGGGVALAAPRGVFDTTRCTQAKNGFPAMSRSRRTLT